MGDSKLPIIAFDGHDGVGKTTLAKTLATAIGGLYLRPFEGSTGLELIAAAEAKAYDKVLQIGKTAIDKKYPSLATSPLIFDRHWITVLSLVPKAYRKCWPPHGHMFTFLCTASLQTIKERIDRRSEKKFEDAYHSYYIQKYLDIAKECQVTVLDTDRLSVDDLLKKVKLEVNLKP